MCNTYDQPGVIAQAGQELAYAHARIGYLQPRAELFDGQWADDITGQQVFDLADVDTRFENLSSFEQELVLDDFEEGYCDAPVWSRVKQLTV